MRQEFTVFRDKTTGDYFSLQNKEKSLEEVKLAVKRPNHEQQQEAQLIYQRFMNKYLKEGIMPRVKLEVMVKDEERDKEEKELARKINDCREQLKRGGIKKSQAVKLAKESIKLNFDWLRLNREKNEVLNNSAETLADNHRFNYLVSCATVYSTSDKPVFNSYDDFLKEDNLGNQVPAIAGEYYAKLIHNLDDDFRKDWPEYRFLQRFNYVNDKLQFVDSEGKLVDFDGKPLPEKTEEVTTDELTAEFLPD